MEQHTDEEILAMYRIEDSRNMALHYLVKKYQERLYWHIRRMVLDHDDTHDILQDTFVKVWKGLANFREDSKLYTWIYRIGTNESIDFLNKKKRQNIMSSDHAGYRMSKSLESDNYFKGSIPWLSSRYSRQVGGLTSSPKRKVNSLNVFWTA